MDSRELHSEGDNSAQTEERDHSGEIIEHMGNPEEAIVCSPLAMVRPTDSSGLELAVSVEAKDEISVWVKRRVTGFGKFLGVSCAGYEDKITELLMEIERIRKSSEKGKSGKRGKSGTRCNRELKQLCCILNFESTGRKEGERRRGRTNS